MRKYIAFIILFICFTTQSQEEKEELKVYSFNEIEKLNKQIPKPIVVFIHTDWCKYCFAMKKNTFNNNEVIKALNDKFYFVFLNAESKKDITFLNHTFKYKPTGNNTGVHQLANELAGIKNRISYPTTTILNSKFEIDILKNGYINSKKMLFILKKYNTTYSNF
ncbi:thioredoxin family protein [Polaribacter sp. Asnod1-A03]|uniref:thioredoxin family protein n=1 Tax=Polaribacter sp. Asnod1-A03 TaxID=3160581 RepID=UPI00386BEA8E